MRSSFWPAAPRSSIRRILSSARQSPLLALLTHEGSRGRLKPSLQLRLEHPIEAVRHGCRVGEVECVLRGDEVGEVGPHDKIAGGLDLVLSLAFVQKFNLR